VVLYSQLSPSCCASKYFAWAPNDYSVVYSATAQVNGHRLDAREFDARYRLRATGFYEDPLQRLLRYLRHYERTYGARDHTTVTVRYRLNGHRTMVWRLSHG
jgi:hypothetical protein